MNEERMGKALDKIETLIIDGNKRLEDRLDRVEGRLTSLEDRVEKGFKEVDMRFKAVDIKIDKLDKKLSDRMDTYYKMLDYDINLVSKKLDEHIKLPVHSQVVMINSINDAFKIIKNYSNGIPFDAIRYLRDNSPSDEILEEIIFSLTNKSKSFSPTFAFTSVISSGISPF